MSVPECIESILERVDGWCIDYVLWQRVPHHDYPVCEAVLSNVFYTSSLKELFVMSSGDFRLLGPWGVVLSKYLYTSTVSVKSKNADFDTEKVVKLWIDMSVT